MLFTMVIYIDENIPSLADALKTCGNIFAFNGRELTNEALVKNKCDALFVRSITKVDKKLLGGTNIKFVASATSGIDHVDTKWLEKAKIKFVYAPGSNANSVAEAVVFAMMKWARGIKTGLRSKNIGIIGFGHIGSIVGRYADNFNMRVLVNDPFLQRNNFELPENMQYAELDELCRDSDIITNHVPLTRDTDFPTYRLIDKEKIESFQQDILFIHTSRGSVVDEEALLSNIKKKHITSVIDVWENEPLVNKELARQSLLALPHITGYSYDGKLRSAMAMAEEFEKFFAVKPKYYEIKKEVGYYKPVNKFNFRDFEYIYTLLLKNRQLPNDHILLLKSLELDDTKRAQAFDEQRKNYPNRRESL